MANPAWGLFCNWNFTVKSSEADHVVCFLAPLVQEPAYDTGAYYKIVTYAASPVAGCSESCVPNVRRSWDTILHMFETDEGEAL